MLDRKFIGKKGEEIACGYLGGKGYVILDRNIATSFGELDIISKSPDKTLVFVEVKTMLTSDNLRMFFPESYPHISRKIPDPLKPEDQMSSSKLAKFRKISEWYANDNPRLSKDGYRLDVVCIDLSPKLDILDIRHYEGI